DPFLARRRVCGLQLYSALKISKEDKERRAEQWVANYRCFDAPVMLLFFIDRIMDTGSYLDYGMFLQSVMLAAVDQGLATCPQAALGEYPNIVRENLGYDDQQVLVCGMALGYEDTSADINSYRTEREAVNAFTEFYID
ncbi:MAG TPA: nitroreductase, partial [Thiolinea sp.]|nr:nitroreductase [Thiolinea sp.]